MKYGDLTYQEICDKANEGYLVIIPTGCTEQQGPHLPVDFDTWFAESLCLAGAKLGYQKYGVKVLVLPVVPFGPTPEHRGYGSGYIHLPQKVHEDVVSSIILSLAEQGFQRIIVWRGCGQHNLTNLIDQFNTDHIDSARVFQPELPFHTIWCEIGDPSVPGGHADSFATSISLYLRPETVRMELISCPEQVPVDWDDPDLDFSLYSPTGVIGDPTYADAELGAKLWQAVVEEVALTLKKVADMSLDCA